MAKKYWLMKSEPGVYSIDDLAKDGSTCWEGVRNYQARNMLRDDIKKGDEVLFYHSNAKPPGVAGIAKVSKSGYPDPYQFDKKSKYFDAKAKKDNPTWFLVDLTHVESFEEVVPLDDLKADDKLEGMLVIRRGQRLSVQPVVAAHFNRVKKLGRT